MILRVPSRVTNAPPAHRHHGSPCERSLLRGGRRRVVDERAIDAAPPSPPFRTRFRHRRPAARGGRTHTPTYSIAVVVVVVSFFTFVFSNVVPSVEVDIWSVALTYYEMITGGSVERDKAVRSIKSKFVSSASRHARRQVGRRQAAGGGGAARSRREIYTKRRVSHGSRARFEKNDVCLARISSPRLFTPITQTTNRPNDRPTGQPTDRTNA